MKDVTIQELNDFLSEHEVLFASSANAVTGKNKRFYCQFEGLYRIEVKGVTMYLGTDPKEALDVFNNH